MRLQLFLLGLVGLALLNLRCGQHEPASPQVTAPTPSTEQIETTAPVKTTTPIKTTDPIPFLTPEPQNETIPDDDPAVFVFGSDGPLDTQDGEDAAISIPVGKDGYWSEYRGPGGTGILAGQELPTELGDETNVKWKTAIHDRGWSSPVLNKKQIWLTTATEDGKKMYAVCVDRDTGEIIHDKLVFTNAEPLFCHETNTYASCTPVVTDERAYVHFGRYGTACLDSNTADVLWERRDILYDSFRGPGSSPILWDGKLFFSCDGVDEQFVIALNAETGETVWKKNRDIDYGTDNGDWKKAYCTPVIAQIGGSVQLICPAAVETISYDPQTGKEHWRVRHGGMNAAARPQRVGDKLLILAGDGDQAMIAVQPVPLVDTFPRTPEASITWADGQMVPKRATPLVLNDRIYSASDKGILSCRNAENGEMIWRERVRDVFWGSPVSDGENIFVCGKEGTVLVLSPGDEYDEVNLVTFPEGFWATPAIGDGALYLRSEHHLYCIQ
ncbi:outer membrane protein assembly factor BamB family protein [Calycomorphotria hydatis]|uniref:Outer membrane biogenesis protein BamB n=1 Tax=Calycomorphotria hydatis TaxID=2528027 RepID=A0A517TAU9_9PLAN|nr:PQQ-binding-like beta-propeller repeat protein [Calycomorphotria hydatis]QDT65498.1 outer membrane biogenesis protein BamB [Calycomorphotria hydatis]